MPERELILVKLESIRHCLERLEAKRPDSAETLKTDFDVQDIVSLNLERIIQLSVDIGLHILSYDFGERPEDMASVFDLMSSYGVIRKDLSERMKKAVGFRNISVHEYKKVDWDIVYSIITANLDDFRKYISSTLGYIE